ncbi:hypothetical protein BO78DRAFT_410584 [Aspergillus sclerotiicarbonarius CBS 121057]|uniref:Uncharacterized protein n=1 Tax=Aspergillus sclerotiicarbonarius (strain CBS 121057 / IBT 28362) TaxID=1448318 RepID=A0A319ENU8_ASPSB|nr:hypothetical protein BO78DRAFT_410584 [Aspergillus sclerotiicarbonarius CBS 121057]
MKEITTKNLSVMSLPSRPFHWPGGIPPEVRPDPYGDRTWEEIFEDTKGWLLFVRENWISRETANVPTTDGDYEVRQRRQLVEAWAKTTQRFRDSFEYVQQAYPEETLSKTSESFPTSASFVCLAPLTETYRSNRSKWTKLNILSYRLDGEMGHCLEDYSHAGVDPNPATFPDPSKFTFTDFLSWYGLEMANFAEIVMIRTVTVLFTSYGMS